MRTVSSNYRLFSYANKYWTCLFVLTLCLFNITQGLAVGNHDHSVEVNVRALDEYGNVIDKTLRAVEKHKHLVFEGDILLAPSSRTANAESGKADAVIRSRNSSRWTDGIVYYQYDVDYSDFNKNKISESMRQIEQVAKIKFVERTDQDDYISFDDDAGCSSYIGRIGGPQRLSLASNCFTTRVIQHELLHALGFWHEHSRSDRDKYVDILMENVVVGQEDNFSQYVNNGINVGDYDYLSVMQYRRVSFSVNGEPTIVKKGDYNAPLGGRSMSPQDIFALQSMYGEAAQEDREFKYLQSVDLVPAASNDLQQGFVRLRNQKVGVVNGYIYGHDDAGNEGDQVIHFSLGPFASKQLNSNDFEYGNEGKDLRGAFGTGNGAWRIKVYSDAEIEVSGYIRTPDGFLTQVDAVTQSEYGRVHNIPIFNPGSNYNQVSKLRLINLSSNTNTFTIEGVDDKGASSVSAATIDVPGQQSITLSAQDLEYGNASIGLKGSIGDGKGKWHLEVVSQRASRVMNLLEAPGGYLSNLSKSSEYKPNPTLLNCSDIDGARIYGSTEKREYLGFLGSSEASESVLNTGNSLGSGASEKSIHNSGGIYGDIESNYSHTNPNAAYPPIVVKNGKALFYLSNNYKIMGTQSYEVITNACQINNSRPAEMFDLSF